MLQSADVVAESPPAEGARTAHLQNSSDGRRLLRPALLSAALLFVAVLAAYWPALDGAFLWDDVDNITESRALHAPGGFPRIWLEPGATQQYFPVLHTLWWCEVRAFGDNPRGYHVVNILLHVTACLLLAHVLNLLKIPGAWFAAALFALHPICVESVAWITEGKNMLALAFLLASLACYLRIDRPRRDEDDSPRNALGWYLASLSLFTLALLSKTNAAALPGVILVVVACRDGRLTRRDVLRVVPMIAIAAAVAAVVIHVEQNLLGAGKQEFDWPWTERVLVAGRACWFYLGKIVWPDPLSFVYPRWRVDPQAPAQWLFPAAALALPVLLWIFRRRIGGAPSAAVLIFGGTLLPQLGLLPLYGQIFSYVADHWAYLSAVPVVVLIAAAAASFAHRLPRGVAYVGVFALLGACALLTWRQAAHYRDEVALWTATLEKNPDCWLAHHNLALHRYQAADYDAAAAGVSRALELRPEFKEAYNTRALIAVKQGRPDDAVVDLRRAVEIDPRFAKAHANLALLLIEQNKPADAASHFRAALERDPDYPQARSSLGLLLARTGQAEESLRELQTAVERDPTDARALVNLGAVLAGLGRMDEATAALQKALDVDPNEPAAHAGLGNLLLARGDAAGAESAYRTSLELDPRQADVQYNLGNVLVRRKQLDAAIESYRRALQLSPDHAPASINLAAVLASRGRREEAIGLLEDVLRRRPDNENAARMLSHLRRQVGSR